MWTEREKTIAKQLDNDEMLALLEKLFTLATSRQLELKAKYAELPDAEYGQLMKVIELSRRENEHRIDLLKKLAKGEKEKKPVATAPR